MDELNTVAPAASDAAPAPWTPVLATAQQISEDTLRPSANRTDQEPGPPSDNIRLLARTGVLGLTTPIQYGGLGAPRSALRLWTECIASACGVTCLVQQQHQTACSLIAGGANEDLKRLLLPDLASGARFSGVAFSHVRRPGQPLVRVQAVEDGFCFNGNAPFVSGWGLMKEVVIAGTLSDGRIVFGAAPIDPGEGVYAGPPMRLCAMRASNTVALTLTDLTLRYDRIVKIVTRDEMARSDLNALLAPTAQAMGLTSAAIALLRTLCERYRSRVVQEAALALGRELTDARSSVDIWIDRVGDPDYKANGLLARARCVALAVRAAHAAVSATGGSANSLDNTAQRLVREAMFYVVAAQTRDVQTATLHALT